MDCFTLSTSFAKIFLLEFNNWLIQFYLVGSVIQKPKSRLAMGDPMRVLWNLTFFSILPGTSFSVLLTCIPQIRIVVPCLLLSLLAPSREESGASGGTLSKQKLNWFQFSVATFTLEPTSSANLELFSFFLFFSPLI